jgi:hypothetical protein
MPPAGFTSLIVADFPALFTEFGGKSFMLLWRGSRDGCRARNFHCRCDGHAPALTPIQDTKGNIFGGFTPVEWEPRTGNWNERFKADPSLMSFLFTLKNPNNFPARKFALKAQKEDETTFVFPITATQKPSVEVALAAVTRTAPAWMGQLFSWVRSISQ